MIDRALEGRSVKYLEGREPHRKKRRKYYIAGCSSIVDRRLNGSIAYHSRISEQLLSIRSWYVKCADWTYLLTSGYACMVLQAPACHAPNRMFSEQVELDR